MKLEIGYNHPAEIRNYGYPCEPLSGKRIVYISDLHYHRFSRQRIHRHIEQIRRINPDILLLGGDYVDTPFGLSNFQYFVGSLSSIPLFAIAGNHDRPYLHRIRQIVENTGATWLHNNSTTLQLGTQRIQIDGTRPAAAPAKSPPSIPSDRPDPDFSILCLHHPIDARPFAHRYNLIFAGHLHGGQIVLWETPRGLYPGRWIYPLNQLSLEDRACRYLISKGLGDTLPIRFNCPRDLIVVTLKPASYKP